MVDSSYTTGASEYSSSPDNSNTRKKSTCMSSPTAGEFSMWMRADTVVAPSGAVASNETDAKSAVGAVNTAPVLSEIELPPASYQRNINRLPSTRSVAFLNDTVIRYVFPGVTRGGKLSGNRTRPWTDS